MYFGWRRSWPQDRRSWCIAIRHDSSERRGENECEHYLMMVSKLRDNTICLAGDDMRFLLSISASCMLELTRKLNSHSGPKRRRQKLCCREASCVSSLHSSQEFVFDALVRRQSKWPTKRSWRGEDGDQRTTCTRDCGKHD